MNANAWLQTTAGKKMALDSTVVVGRNPDCEIRLTDNSVSQRHALIHHSAKSGDWIANLSNTNKVRVNGAAIACSVRLRNGDVIELGAQKFNYRRAGKARTQRHPRSVPPPNVRIHLNSPESTLDGVILIREHRELQFISKNALLSLQTYFPVPADHGLPPAISTWLDRNLGDNTRLPLLTFLGKSRLELSIVEESSDHCLVFTRESEPISNTTIAVRLGVSPREGEVMLWVAAGKSNPEISIILGIALRTVVHHLENIFQKLGLESRHGAICLVLALSDFPSR